MAYSQGDRKAAHQTIDTLLKTEPNSAVAQLLKARWLLNEGQVGEALERATLAVTANGRMVTAHYIRGLAEIASHRSADAIKSFTQVLRLNPRAVAAQVQLSNLYLQRANLDTAVNFADEALRNAPNSLDAHLVRVRALMARNDVKPARAALAVLKKLGPAVAEVYALEGTIELGAGNAMAARAALERALRLDPRSMEALTGLTALDMVQNRAAPARARVEARLASGDETPPMLMLAAKVYVAERDFPRAEALLRKSIARDPLDTANYALLGRVLQEQNTLDRSKAELDTAAASDPRNLPARLLGALIVHTQGDVDQAKQRYEEVLKIEPRAAMAANNLAAIYADSGENLDRAQQLAETAAEQLPAAAEIQDTLGWVYYRRQLNGQAIAQFQQSINRDSANPVYHYHLGLAYSKNGDRDQARAAFQRALQLNPGYADARQALAALGA
jgi:tetratricopeptide (TPR) repeat protein